MLHTKMCDKKLTVIFIQVDPVTQARLEALFETAGIGKIAGESKPLADPEVRQFIISNYLLLFSREIAFRQSVDYMCSFKMFCLQIPILIHESVRCFFTEICSLGVEKEWSRQDVQMEFAKETKEHSRYLFFSGHCTYKMRDVTWVFLCTLFTVDCLSSISFSIYTSFFFSNLFSFFSLQKCLENESFVLKIKGEISWPKMERSVGKGREWGTKDKFSALGRHPSSISH